MRVAIYSRCSTDHHDQNPEVQVQELKRYCEARGWVIVESIVDHGISGSSANRPGLKQLMTLARSRKIDGVVVLNLSRLFRSLKNLISTLDEFASLNVCFVSIHEQFDFSTATGKLLVGVIGALNEFTRELIRENTKLGLEYARKKGKTLGRPKIRDDDRILQLRSEGLSYGQIQKRLGISRAAVYRAIKSGSKTPAENSPSLPLKDHA